MNEASAGNKYMELKRQVYLVLLPFLLATNLFYWFYSPNVNKFMEITLPPTCVLLIVLWGFVYKKRLIPLLEIVCLVWFSAYHLIRVQTMTVELTDNHLNVYMFWSPMFYIFIFLVLKREIAMYFSGVVFLLIILTTIPLVDHVRAQDIMVQYYLSTAIYIVLLFYFTKVLKTYIESDMLVKNAYFDHLTNIGNRRSVDMWIENELERSAITNKPFSIIYFDIDHFKQVNDVYGHDVGDHVLKEFSSLVKSLLRVNDNFGRWGGEEFIIITSDENLCEASQFAEMLRKKIEEYSFQHVEHITSSFGVTTYEENDVEATMIKRADDALYYAKNNGRNKVASSNNEPVII